MTKFNINWSKTYISTGSVEVEAETREEALSKVKDNIGDYTGSMQYIPDLDEVDDILVLGESKPTIDTYVSAEDGITVVHIDTSELPENSNGPIMRVYINDDIDNPVYDNGNIMETKERLSDISEIHIGAEVYFHDPQHLNLLMKMSVMK